LDIPRIPIKAERILIRVNSYNFYRHDVRETVSHHACFYIVKPQFLVESLQIYCTRRARNANDQRQQENGAKNLRTTFRGSVSRLDGCRDLLSTFTFQDIHLLSCQKNARKLCSVKSRMFSECAD